MINTSDYGKKVTTKKYNDKKMGKLCSKQTKEEKANHRLWYKGQHDNNLETWTI